MKKITEAELLEMFDPEVHDRLRASLDKHDGLVVFENQAFDSSQFGARSALPYGPEASNKRLEDLEGKWLNDLPSQRQYAVAYCTRKG